MNDTDDTPPPFDVEDVSDKLPIPCPPLPGPWPERITARCVCCGDRMECFIERRGLDLAEPSSYAIPVADHPNLLAKAASCVGLDGRGGWLLVQSAKDGHSWICRDCVKVAVDFGAPEVTEAVKRFVGWKRIEFVDKSGAGEVRRTWLGRKR